MMKENTNTTHLQHNFAKIGRLFAFFFIAVALLASGTASGKELQWAEVKAKIRKQFPTVTHISTATLATWQKNTAKSPFLLLDVRSEEEFHQSHIRGAIRAETLSQSMKILKTQKKNVRIVLYCSVGYRSSALAAKLQKQGYTKVFNVEGSIFQWKNEGRRLYGTDGPTEQIHPYNEEWGQLLNTNKQKK